MAKILGVVGSLRKKSHTRKMVRITLEYAEQFGGEVRTLDLAETPLPIYHPDLKERDAVQNQVAEMVLWADAFLLGCPDYHGSMSGPIVNFLDYFWHEFTGKLFGFVVASHEKGLTVQRKSRSGNVHEAVYPKREFVAPAVRRTDRRVRAILGASFKVV